MPPRATRDRSKKGVLAVSWKNKRAAAALKKGLRVLLWVLLGAAGLGLLLTLSPLLLLLLLIPARLTASYGEGGLTGAVRYAFLRFPLKGRGSEPKKPASGEKSSGRKGEQTGEKPKKEKKSLSGRTALLRPMLSAAGKALEVLLRHLRVRELDVRIRAAAGDAADTAVLYGRLYAAAGTVYSLLGARGKLGRFHFEARPDFDGEKTVWEVRADVSMQGIWAVWAALRGGTALLGALIRNALSGSGNSTPDGVPSFEQVHSQTTTKGGKTMAHPIENLMGTSMQKIREMVDVNTMIGDPIRITEKITVIPVSRASFGFASGGSDIPSKQDKELFGGGAGAGVKIDPVAFIVVNGDDVQILPYSPAPAPGADRAISMVPGLIEQISSLFKKKKDDEGGDAPAGDTEPSSEAQQA